MYIKTKGMLKTVVIKFSYGGFSSDIKVIKSSRKTVAIQIKPDGIILRAPRGIKNSDIEKIINDKAEWIKRNVQKMVDAKQRAGHMPSLTAGEIDLLKKQAKLHLARRVAHYANLAGVDYGKISVRSQKTRWGSCSSNGNLSFNCLLMLLPEEIIDSVVVHEVCHRKHMNHSQNFYREIERIFPNYAACRKWLKENGSAYLARLPK